MCKYMCVRGCLCARDVFVHISRAMYLYTYEERACVCLCFCVFLFLYESIFICVYDGVYDCL